MQDDDGDSDLARAIIDGKEFEEVNRLLVGGADPNHRNNEGNTPCMFVVMYWRHDLVYLFLKHGGNFYQRNNNGLFPVALCEFMGNVDMLGDIVDQDKEDELGRELDE